jgi:hypothetical protein
MLLYSVKVLVKEDKLWASIDLFSEVWGVKGLYLALSDHTSFFRKYDHQGAILLTYRSFKTLNEQYDLFSLFQIQTQCANYKRQPNELVCKNVPYFQTPTSVF